MHMAIFQPTKFTYIKYVMYSFFIDCAEFVKNVENGK
jgi:hypothetical protein